MACVCRERGALLLALAVSSCAPEIHFFRAEPNVSCRGDAVTLQWEATAAGQLTSTAGESHDVDAKGSLAVRPPASTTYRLVASRLFGHTTREVGVTVREPAAPKTIGATISDPSASCDNGVLTIVADIPANLWDPGLRVASVQVTRRYHVEHDGATADLDPGSRSTAFADHKVSGSWKLSTPLAGGEACGTPNLPRTLNLDVWTQCQGAP